MVGLGARIAISWGAGVSVTRIAAQVRASPFASWLGRPPRWLACRRMQTRYRKATRGRYNGASLVPAVVGL